MNHGSEPIFKPEEMRAAYHPNRSIRFVQWLFTLLCLYVIVCIMAWQPEEYQKHTVDWGIFVFGYFLTKLSDFV